MDLFSKGRKFPPEEHQDRIDKYRENKKLVKGDHWEVFKENNLGRSSKMYVSVNLAGIIAKKSADFLIGDGVLISAGKEDNSPEQKALDNIRESNDLDILFYESALSNAYRGDSFFRVRYGQKHNGAYPELFDESGVIIEAVSAEHVFPEADPFNENLISVYHVAIPVRLDDGTKQGKYILNVESHTAGHILYRTFELMPTLRDVYGNILTYTVGTLISAEEAITGIPVPLIVHVANFGLDDGWQGLDDITELKPLFDELNNRLSQVASILDKHANPAMAVPMGILTEDENGRPMFNVENSKVFELDEKDRMPQYITWNGQLQECYSEISRITEFILMTAEIPAVALGSGDAGTSGSSGLSIRFRLNSLLAKIKRKRKYYEKGLKQVMMIAQYLDTKVGTGTYEVVKPHFTFTDGLDDDEMQKANMMAVRTGGAVTMSQKRAIMQLDGLTEEQADVEIDRIRSEQEHNEPDYASPSIFNDVDEPVDSPDDAVDEVVEPAKE